MKPQLSTRWWNCWLGFVLPKAEQFPNRAGNYDAPGVPESDHQQCRRV